jgi:hypothetical protein
MPKRARIKADSTVQEIQISNTELDTLIEYTSRHNANGVLISALKELRRRRDDSCGSEELARLQKLLNTPEILDFSKAVVLEAAHQRERWGAKKDEGKTDADWFWLIGYLAGKALHGPENTPEKQLHRIITIAAASCNWHAQVLGKCDMRPGLSEEKKNELVTGSA